MHKTFIILCVTISLIAISCGNSSKNNKTNKENLSEAAIVLTEDLDKIIEDPIDIPIAINLVHYKDKEMGQTADVKYKVTCETNNDIYIDINSNYYKKYTSGHRFKACKLAYFEKSEVVEYLTLSLDVVNNTNEKLSINELDVIVDESKPDSIPIIYICTTEECCNCIYFVNESWFDWNGFTFSYSLLEKGETFNGKYKMSRHIPYFDSYVIIDLLPDMIEMGYDFPGLIECINNYYKRKHDIDEEFIEDNDIDEEFIEDNDMDRCVVLDITDDDEALELFKEKFKPFEYGGIGGFATLYGSIKFDDIDFKVDFIANIILSTGAGFGAMSYQNDEFDVKLRSSSKEYTLRYPYTTVIEPYGAEMIKLSIIADKSSSHELHIDIKNDNGLNIKSKNIHFHHYYPKN